MADAASGAASSAKSLTRQAGEAIGTIGVVGGVADWIEGDGFDKTGAAAGEVLRPIFGGVPWEMSAAEIVDAVVPNFLPDFIPGAADSAAAMIDVGLHLF